MMKRIILSSLVGAFCITGHTNANLAIPHDHADSYLETENVTITIAEGIATVKGTFTYNIDRLNKSQWPGSKYPVLTLYLPVYAVEGTPAEKIKPQINHNGKELSLNKFIAGRGKTTILDPNAGRFGSMPQIEGQKVYWFSVSFSPKQKKETVEIHYRQHLAAGKFIYTPLIPKQVEGNLYGSISLAADQPMNLLNPNQHRFKKSDGKIVVEPAHKRAIIVQLAQANDQ